MVPDGRLADMEVVGAAALVAIATLFVVFTAAIVLFLAAVWFGLYVVAPRIRRALDRTEIEDEDAGDRPG
jgi:membrane protein implicated in regulation of membrane protease activity